MGPLGARFISATPWDPLGPAHFRDPLGPLGARVIPGTPWDPWGPIFLTEVARYRALRFGGLPHP